MLLWKVKDWPVGLRTLANTVFKLNYIPRPHQGQHSKVPPCWALGWTPPSIPESPRAIHLLVRLSVLLAQPEHLGPSPLRPPEIPVCRFRFSPTQQSLVLPDPSNIFVASCSHIKYGFSTFLDVWDRQASKEWSCGYMTTLSLLKKSAGVAENSLVLLRKLHLMIGYQ